MGLAYIGGLSDTRRSHVRTRGCVELNHPDGYISDPSLDAPFFSAPT